MMLLSKFKLPARISPKTSTRFHNTFNEVTPDQVVQIQDTARKAVDEHINPYIKEWEQAKRAPLHKVFKKFGDLGLLGISHPEEYGGLNLPYSVQGAASYELGNAHALGIMMALGVQTDMATPALASHGSDWLRKEYLEPTIAGDMVCCIGVSEPGAGSDVANIKTFAEYDPKTEEYVINGGKIWTTNVTQADWMCLLVNTKKINDSDGLRAKFTNKSLIVLPLNLPGIKIVSHDMNKMGMKCSDWGQTYFEDVRVPKSHIIGEPNMGFIYQMEQFQFERLVGVSGCLRPLENLLEQTAQYTKDRTIFGKTLADQQSIKFKLAEMTIEVELMKALYNETLRMVDEGDNVTKQATMLKYKLGILAKQIPDACVQIHGAQGYLEDSYVNRMYRDLRGVAIGGGADEVMLQYLSKMLGY